MKIYIDEKNGWQSSFETVFTGDGMEIWHTSSDGKEQKLNTYHAETDSEALRDHVLMYANMMFGKYDILAETETVGFNYIGCLELPTWAVDQLPMHGHCDAAVAEILEDDDVLRELGKIDPAKLALELREYGAWDENELSDHKENLARILWIALGDIRDGRN